MDITQYPIVTRVTTLSLLLGTLSGCDLFNKDDEAEAPEAGFSVNKTSGTAPVTVAFTDTSEDGSEDIYQWLWEFGDGNTSSLQNPQHDYPIPGTYTVSLTVTSEDGADTETRTDLISVEALPPVAAFSVSSTTGDAPLTVTFSEDSTQGTGTINQWAWDFGDGNTSTEQSPSHIYTEPGEYTVSLTVSDEYSSHTVTATEPVVVMEVPPEAAMEVSATSGDMPFTVTFTDTSSAGSGEITQWLWDFGDGTTSDEANPSHTYTEPGNYTVSLTVTADSTDTVTRDRWIEVIDPYVILTLNVMSVYGDVLGDIDVISETLALNSVTENNYRQLVIRLLPTEDSGVLRLQKAGYTDSLVYLDAVGISNSINVTMSRRGTPFTFSGAEGGEFSTGDGAKVTIEPYSLVDAEGNIVSSDIDLYITPVNVSDSAERNAFPGSFFGEPDMDIGDVTQIASYGVVEMSFYANQQELQLVDGATAQLEVPLFIAAHLDGSVVMPGDAIPFWILDETNGIWMQEGFGEVVESSYSTSGLALAATTPHFSWFNADHWDVPGSDPLPAGEFGAPQDSWCELELHVEGPEVGDPIIMRIVRTSLTFPYSVNEQLVRFDGGPIYSKLYKGSYYSITLRDQEGHYAGYQSSCQGQDIVAAMELPDQQKPVFSGWDATIEPVVERINKQYTVTKNRITFGGGFASDDNNLVEVFSAIIPSGSLYLPDGAHHSVEVTEEDGEAHSITAILENENGQTEFATLLPYINEQKPVLQEFGVSANGLAYTINWQESWSDDVEAFYLQAPFELISFGTVPRGDSSLQFDLTEYGFSHAAGQLFVRFSNQYGEIERVLELSSTGGCNTDMCVSSF